MNPDNNQNLSPGAPASLPAVPLQPQPGSPAAAPQPGITHNLAEQVGMQAKSLVEQYQQDPYRLSGALQQLKSKYLADQFQITPKSADD